MKTSTPEQSPPATEATPFDDGALYDIFFSHPYVEKVQAEAMLHNLGIDPQQVHIEWLEDEDYLEEQLEEELEEELGEEMEEGPDEGADERPKN